MSKPSPAELRAAAIFEQAAWGLLEYYPCLNDQTLCLEFESVVKVPDTGNDQLDYENVRDQLERQCKRYEKLHPGVIHEG